MSKISIKMLSFIVVALTLIMTACSTQKLETKKPQTQQNVIVEIEFFNWMEQAELAGWEKVFDAFSQEFPNIKLNVNSVPASSGYEDKLKVTLMTGNAPEIFQASTKSDFKLLCFNDLVYPLNDKANKDSTFDFSDYHEKILSPFTVNNNVYALPKDNSVIGLVFNKKLFDENNIAYPDENWTWNDLKTAAKKISKDTNGDGVTDIFGFASIMMRDILVDPVFLLGYGAPGMTNYQKGDKITINDPRNIEAFNFFHEMFIKDKSAPSLASQLNSVDLFNSGKLGILVGATHMFPSLFKGGIDFGVTMLPKNENGNRSATLFTSGFAISKNSKNIDAAWETIKYLSYGEGNKILSQSSGSVPATKKYLEVFITEEKKKVGIESLLKMMEYQVAWNYGEREAELRKEYQTLIDKIFSMDNIEVADIINQSLPSIEKVFEPFK